jgi:homopolymeric O-antigen transport system ATP-binding protein
LLVPAADTVIRAEGLSKRYLVGHERANGVAYKSLRETVTRELTTLGRNVLDMVRGRQIVQGDEIEEFWALKDVSFEVKRGEVLGIIGRNGAGKSTLLKVLSRITEPTEGRVRIRGRVASLLEVGTGFHPELTGRENIYLNGAILGMTRAEIRRKFDEIVAFAEVETFIDTPVKRYSSGMYVRLAFAVAAHLEPEILIVDEVLAVGDAAFQEKCMGRMNDVVRGGRTILFVSHNMHAVERLCQRVLHLDCGSIAGVYDNAREGVMNYLHADGAARTPTTWVNRGNDCRNDYFVAERLETYSTAPDVDAGAPFPLGHPFRLRISGAIKQADPALVIGLAIYSEDGDVVFWTFTSDAPEASQPTLAPGPFCIETEIPAHFLNEGEYRAELVSHLRNRRWLIEPRSAPAFVTFSMKGGALWARTWSRSRPGVVAPVLPWKNTPGPIASGGRPSRPDLAAMPGEWLRGSH